MNKKYWLRGALIGVIIYLLLFIIWTIISEQLIGFVAVDIITLVAFLPASILFFVLGIYFEKSPLLYPIIYALLAGQGFVIGAIISWLYGKIKNRNKNI